MIEQKLIKILENMAYLLELKGENPFKARAYLNAAKTIKEDKINIALAVHDGTLKDIKGFGDALQKKISEFVSTGKIDYYENLLKEVPKGLLEISKISSIGFSKARTLYFEHNIKSLDELELACIEDRLSKLKGFGEKSQEYILTSIHHKKASKGKFLQQEARIEAEKILKVISEFSSVGEFHLSCDIRRLSEVISSIHVIVAGDDMIRFSEELNGHYTFKQSASQFIYDYSDSIKVIIDYIPQNQYALRLHETSASDEYNIAFTKSLRVSGLDVRDNLLFKNNEIITPKSEKELYELAGLQYVAPELREFSIALDAARDNKLPELVKLSDMRGMLHVHTLWSDGIKTIKEMALAAKALGFEYIAICDHSRTAVYTNGLTIERVFKQHEEIERLNDEDLGIRILKGIESDILPDGSLDYPEDILERFDLVVASVHSSFNMSKTRMTDRIIHALMSPYTDILGHPTGRLLLSRPPYEVDIREVIDAAAELRKIIEINANPYRLDLSWENAYYAKQKGVKLAINPDSHTSDTLGDVKYGIQVARKAWLTKEDVVNCLPESKISKVNKD